MRTSDKTTEIAKSLFAFQRDVKPPRTDARADTGKFSYPYLTLPGLLAHCRPQLEEWGLVVLQEIQREDGGIGVTTRVIHAPSGEWIEMGPLFLPATGTPQNFGSAITYGRRYAFAAALNIAADDDDDGASAASSPPQEEPAPPPVTSGRDGAAGNAGAGGGDAAYGEGATTSDPAPAQYGDYVTDAAIVTVQAPPLEAPPKDQRPPAVVAARKKSEAQATMEEYHPGRPHRMRDSENLAGARFCAGYGSVRCGYFVGPEEGKKE